MNNYGDELEQEPTSAEAYNERGWSKYEQKDYEGALKDLDKAIELDSNSANAYNNRARAKYYKKDYLGAIKDYYKTIGLKLDNAWLLIQLQVIRLKIKLLSKII